MQGVLVPLIAGFAGVLFGAVLVRSAGASRLRFKAAWSKHRLGGRAQVHRLALFARQSGTSLRLVPCLLRVVRASWRSALVARFARLEAPCLSQVRHGKLALMARDQSVLNQPPNPFIERTPSGMLRMPTVAAHVQR